MNIQDMILLGCILFGVGVVLYSSAFLGNVVLDQFKNTSAVQNVSVAVDAVSGAQGGFGKFDVIFMGFFIGFALFVWLSAYFIGGNPVFTWVYVVIMVLMLIVTPALSNVWEKYSQNPYWVSQLGSFPMMNHILTFLPLYVFIVELVGFVILFAKGRSEQIGYV